MRAIVLDCSAAVEILLNRPRSSEFRTLLMDCEFVTTSELYRAETANVLWKYHRAGLLGRDECNRLYNIADDMVDRDADFSENAVETLNEAIHLSHPVYDLLYFTLARRLGALLLTRDKRLATLARENGVETVPEPGDL
jgi:predicted nucleic acid-binding protein